MLVEERGGVARLPFRYAIVDVDEPSPPPRFQFEHLPGPHGIVIDLNEIPPVILGGNAEVGFPLYSPEPTGRGKEVQVQGSSRRIHEIRALEVLPPPEVRPMVGDLGQSGLARPMAIEGLDDLVAGKVPVGCPAEVL